MSSAYTHFPPTSDLWIYEATPSRQLWPPLSLPDQKRRDQDCVWLVVHAPVTFDLSNQNTLTREI